MKVILKVQGDDDFGREEINHPFYKYSHHYPRTEKGDIIIYYHRKPFNISVYMVQNDEEHYYKDGFHYESGTMKRLTGPKYGFNQWLDGLYKISPKLYHEAEDRVVEVLRKYNPECLTENQ